MKHTNSVPDPRASRANFKRASSEPPSSNPASTPSSTTSTHLSALCNHLEEASTCFIAPPSGFYSDNLRNYNLSPWGAHKLPSPCSVTWSSNSSAAYQWDVHFLLDDFLEVIEGLFKDGRLNATRQQDTSTSDANDFEVYLAGDFAVQKRSPSEGYRYYYELSYTLATLRLFALVEQEELGNIRAELARYGIHIGEVK